MNENVAPGKTKSQLRAERRAVQEAQRAVKASGKGSTNQRPQEQQQRQRGAQSQATHQQEQKAPKKKTSSGSEAARSRSRDSVTTVQSSTAPSHNVDAASIRCAIDTGRSGSREDAPSVVTPMISGKIVPEVHPIFEQLALRIDPSGSIRGSDAQCLATIDAFRQLTLSYQPPADKSYSREFENAIKPCISRIARNRSLPPAIASLVKQLKLHLSTISNDTPENEAREQIVSWLEDFADRNIILSTRAIAEAVTFKLKMMARNANDPVVVMIYTYSATVEKTLLEAHRQGVHFEVIVVDSMPLKEGLISVRRLTNIGVKCQYVLLTGISAVLRSVNFVLLGAEGLLANGNVIALLGSTQLAMTANARNVPVLVLCHTYKFCEKVFTVTFETEWPNTEVMPADFVTGVVTELRTLPCSAVPAVLRVKQLGGGIS